MNSTPCKKSRPPCILDEDNAKPQDGPHLMKTTPSPKMDLHDEDNATKKKKKMDLDNQLKKKMSLVADQHVR